MNYANEFGFPVSNEKITFKDEKNRSKLIKFLDRIGTYTGYDKDMNLRVFVDGDNDFCAFEAVDYRLSFLSTAHKIIEMYGDWRVIEPVTISKLRSMIAVSE